MKVNSKNKEHTGTVHWVSGLKVALDSIQEQALHPSCAARAARKSRAFTRGTRRQRRCGGVRGRRHRRKGFNTHVSLQWVRTHEGTEGGEFHTWEGQGGQAAQGALTSGSNVHVVLGGGDWQQTLSLRLLPQNVQ